MRALVVVPCRFWGGPEKQTLQLARSLRDHHRVELVIAVMPHDTARADENPLIVRARSEGLEAVPFLQTRNYDLVEGHRILRALIARYRPDVLCATGYKADVLVSRPVGLPTLAMVRGWTSEDWKVRFYEWFDRRALRRFDSIAVVSRALGERIRKLGIPPERVHLVPNAIDPARLPPPLSRDALCHEAGLRADAPIVGAVGRLSPEKGHRLLLQAFAAVLRAVPTAQLVLVGDGPDEAALRRLADELGLAECTRFMGLRADGQQIVGALDVMALPSFTEGMPNVILEAFAYGTPVVATSVGGVPDLVQDGVHGWLVPVGEPEHLAQALIAAIKDRAEAGARAGRARVTLEANFTAADQAEAWLRAAEAAVESWAARTRQVAKLPS